MTHYKSLVATGIAVVLALLAGASTGAATMTRPNYLTFNRSIALPGVVLPAGTYTFQANPQDVHPDIVRVLSRDGQRVYFTGFTTPVGRPAHIPAGASVGFAEGAAGEPIPIAVWYPANTANGHRFIYR